MTMGPEPSRRIVSRSSRRGIRRRSQAGARGAPHGGNEISEVMSRVVGARRGFGVVLDREQWALDVPEPLHRPVVEVDVGDLELRGALHHALPSYARFPNREAVIVAGDVDAAGSQVLDRMVPAVMAELELVGRAAVREREQLVPQADPERGGVWL